MEIIINDKWKISGDKRSVTVSTWTDFKKSKHGLKGTWDNDNRYYPNLETAFMHLIDMDISDSDVTTFQYLTDHINKFKREVLECLNKIEKENSLLSVKKLSGKSSKSKLRKRESPSKNSTTKSSKKLSEA